VSALYLKTLLVLKSETNIVGKKVKVIGLGDGAGDPAMINENAAEPVECLGVLQLIIDALIHVAVVLDVPNWHSLVALAGTSESEKVPLIMTRELPSIGP